MPITKLGEARIPVVELVATNTPRGKVVLTEYGVINDPKGPELATITASKVNGVLKNFKYVKGSDVGLEWRTPDGKKLPTSDNWAANSWVVMTKLEGDERIGQYGQPVSLSAFCKAKRVRNQADVDNLSPQEYTAWMDELAEMQNYLAFVKSLEVTYVTTK